MLRKITRLLLLLILGVVLHFFVVGLGAPAYLAHIAEREMPGFELTEEWLGREVVPAKTFFAVGFVGWNGRSDAAENLKAFLRLYDDNGLPAFRLILRSKGSEDGLWSVELPGCAPKHCAEADFSHLLVPISESEAEPFGSYSSNPNAEFRIFYETSILGIQAKLKLTTATNELGQVVQYYIGSSRSTTINPLDQFDSVLHGGSGEAIPSAIFSKNLVLGVSETSW